jgi:hypothetical protein
VRAEAATGDLWGCDPACYLSDDEIGIPSKSSPTSREKTGRGGGTGLS